MAHIHKDIDLVVTGFIAFTGRVLFVYHKKLDLWLAPGGHVELHEDTEQALEREILEETGLVLGHNLYYQNICRRGGQFRDRLLQIDPAQNHNHKLLHNPVSVEMHDFPPLPGHRHLCLVYYLNAVQAEVKLEASAHSMIRWVPPEEFHSASFKTLETIRIHADNVLKQGP